MAFVGPASKAFRYSLLLHLVGVLSYSKKKKKKITSCCALAEKETTKTSLQIPPCREGALCCLTEPVAPRRL